MVNVSEEKNRHFILSGVTKSELFRPFSGGSKLNVPARDRVQHGNMLLNQIDALRPVAEAAKKAQKNAGLEKGFGIQVVFESFPNIKLAFENLARDNQGIELLNVRQEENCIHATVFVPYGKLVHFENLIRNYLLEKKDKNGNPIDNKRLIETIKKIRAAELRALWTDDLELYPTPNEGPFWWEVWLPVRNQREEVVAEFCQVANAHGMDIAQGEIFFPERTVLLVKASLDQMESSIDILNSIAELRRNRETANFFDTLAPEEQHEWINDLLGRVQFQIDGINVSYVCLLDTGINRGHKLLSSAIDDNDLHTVYPDSGTNDLDGHGTGMAGLALFGNLTDILEGCSIVHINHRLESVKLLCQNGNGGTYSQHYGFLTKEAVSRPEIKAPLRTRVFGMAITAIDNRDRGKPSAWSAALDSLTADTDANGIQPRLLILAAGNVDDMNAWANYPKSNETDEVHDPAQSWNALTVGACTNLVNITKQSAGIYKTIAPAGGLSPFSTTSLTWEPQWPIKPDVVFEGGNAVKDIYGATRIPDLLLLTTHNHPIDKPLTTFEATSAATALASRFAAQVMTVYPDLWPETVRALIVHSAEWTDAMKLQNLSNKTNPSKADYLQLLRCCGFGVPNLDRALWSVSNSLTLIDQERLSPFKKEPKESPTFCDMQTHNLPWPIEILEELGETQVKLRVTLSYFIEPNPSHRGYTSHYMYESHGLRFDVKRPYETIDDFRYRINNAARDEKYKTHQSVGGSDSGWLIGPKGRHKGSLHGDIWQGSAADLANRGHIAVYPVRGWWKIRQKLNRYNQTARYALVVSILAPEIDVDLYAEVENRISTSIMA